VGGGHAGGARRHSRGALGTEDNTIIVATANPVIGLPAVVAAGGPTTDLTGRITHRGRPITSHRSCCRVAARDVHDLGADGRTRCGQVAVLDLQTGKRNDPRARRQ